ncbi:MAG: hypothetical protein WCD76_04650, partial [Pyrinomonadaceae bacterium]
QTTLTAHTNVWNAPPPNRFRAARPRKTIHHHAVILSANDSPLKIRHRIQTGRHGIVLTAPLYVSMFDSAF